MSDDVEPTLEQTVAPPATITQKPEMPSWRLVATLAVAGSLAALLLSFVYEATRPLILENKAKVLRGAVAEVLKDPAAVVSLKVTPTGLEADDEVVYLEEKGVERVYLGYADEAKQHPIGFALVGAAYGYGSDPIKIALGYDAKSGEIIGMKVLEAKETPGIGTKIETDDSFAGLFWRGDEEGGRPARKPPLQGRRDDQFDASDPHQLDMISGATISSTAILKIVNDLWERLGERLQAYAATEGA